ncbi:MAG: aspartate kinase [Candidatus Micrarchaeota archaeon]|nr:aspartate kinase [Candidatus Micrarchaeota archaeon]
MAQLRTVAKIGGSTLLNSESFYRASQLCKDHSADVVAISAANGITKMLEKAAQEAVNSKFETFYKIKEYHNSIYKDNQTCKMHNQLYKKLKEVSTLNYLTSENLAEIKCFGERFSAYVFSQISGFRLLLPEKIQITAQGDYLTAVAIEKNFNYSLFNNGTPSVVPGYYGVDGGKIKLFGRSGTDYSAAFLAKVLGAREVYFFKELDGYMTANPKIVKNAKLREEMDYQEVKLLGNSGSQIIHPGVAQLLERTPIICWVKNFFDPTRPGTKISANKSKNSNGFSIANKDTALLTIEDVAMAQAPNYAAGVFGLLGSHNINIEIIGTAQTVLSFTISREDSSTSYNLLSKAGYGQILLNEDVTLISIVGDAFEYFHLLQKTFQTMVEGNYNLYLISQSQKTAALSIVVDSSKAIEIINNLHNRLMGID